MRVDIYSNKNVTHSYFSESVLVIAILCSIILPNIPLQFLSSVNIFPNIALIIIYLSFVARMTKHTYFALFVFGILIDTFNIFTIGFTPLIWLLSVRIYDFFVSKLVRENVFLNHVRDFFIFDFLNTILSWIIISFINTHYYPIADFMKQFILNVIFFIITLKIVNVFQPKLKLK